MNRRDLIKLLLSTPLAATLDYEKLLWVPRPIIVVPSIPSKLINLEDILALELETIQENLITLFDRDDTFFKMLKNGEIKSTTMGLMRVPLMIKPGGFHDED